MKPEYFEGQLQPKVNLKKKQKPVRERKDHSSEKKIKKRSQSENQTKNKIIIKGSTEKNSNLKLNKGLGWTASQVNSSKKDGKDSGIYFNEENCKHQTRRVRSQSPNSKSKTCQQTCKSCQQKVAKKDANLKSVSSEREKKAKKTNCNYAKSQTGNESICSDISKVHRDPCIVPTQVRVHTTNATKAKTNVEREKNMGTEKLKYHENNQRFDIRQGPRARVYHKIEGAEDKPFHTQSVSNLKLTGSKYSISMLVSTGSFRDRKIKKAAVNNKYLVDYQPWNISEKYIPENKSKLAKTVNCINLELESNSVQSNGQLRGRVHLDLKNTVEINSINFLVKHTTAMISTDGKIIQPENSEEQQISHLGRNVKENNAHNSKEFDTIQKVPEQIKLPAGSNVIEFTLVQPDSAKVCFNFTNNGQLVYSVYTLKAEISIDNNKVAPLCTVFDVPCRGVENYPLVSEEFSEVQLGLLNVCGNKYNPLELVVADIKGRIKSPTYRLTRTINCSRLNISNKTEAIVSGKISNRTSDQSNTAQSLETKKAPLGGDHKQEFTESINLPEDIISTIHTPEFTCEYTLEVNINKTTYQCGVYICDHLDSDSKLPSEAIETLKWKAKN